MTSGNGRAIGWYSFTKPYSIAKGTTASTFMYGPDRARTQQVVTTDAGTKTVKYLGTLYEKITETGKPTEYRHYIGAGSRVAIYTQKSDSTEKTRYLHKDHLGSVDVITKEDGTVTERLSFDPHGKRRQINWQDAITAIVPLETSRGLHRPRTPGRGGPGAHERADLRSGTGQVPLRRSPDPVPDQSAEL